MNMEATKPWSPVTVELAVVSLGRTQNRLQYVVILFLSNFGKPATGLGWLISVRTADLPVKGRKMHMHGISGSSLGFRLLGVGLMA